MKLYYTFKQEWDDDIKEFSKQIGQDISPSTFVIRILQKISTDGYMAEKNPVNKKKWDEFKYPNLETDPAGRRVIVFTGEQVYNGLLKMYKYVLLSPQTDIKPKSFGEFVDKLIESQIKQIQAEIINKKLEAEVNETLKEEVKQVQKNFKDKIISKQQNG